MDPYVAFIAKLAEKLADLFKLLRNEKVRRNNEASQYFNELSNAMNSVLQALKAREIPRIEGHKMEELMRALDSKTTGVFNHTKSGEIRNALTEVVNLARVLDGHYIVYQPELEADRESMLREIERVVGDCRGIAAVLKSEA